MRCCYEKLKYNKFTNSTSAMYKNIPTVIVSIHSLTDESLEMETPTETPIKQVDAESKLNNRA